MHPFTNLIGTTMRPAGLSISRTAGRVLLYLTRPLPSVFSPFGAQALPFRPADAVYDGSIALAVGKFVPHRHPIRAGDGGGRNYISAIRRTVFAVRIVNRPPTGAAAVFGHQFVFW